MTRISRQVTLLVAAAFLVSSASAGLSCETDEFCAFKFRKGSECIDGECTNPFYNGGCLKTMLPDWHKTRVCGSEDPPEAETMGFCRKSPFYDYYPEVRLGIQNWESSYMLNWIFQILFSEILEVPVSVELGKPDTNADFYNVNSAWDWGAATNIDALRTAHAVQDCRLFQREKEEESETALETRRQLAGLEDPPDPNKGCANMLGELWKNSYLDIIRQLEEDDIILRPTSLGVLAKEDFVIPQRTAARFPEMSIFHGLSGGDETRQKLADIFLRPTTWGDYCEQVSNNNCTKGDDGIAVRPPKDEGEANKYFVDGEYTGHFRITEEGNCTTNPTDCSGIFIDYPCEWSMNTMQKLVWLNIPLTPVQFSYSELLQINSAANATKANFIGAWWKPDPLHELWFGTDSQLIQVYLPPATQECLDNRNGIDKRCLDDPVVEAGSSLGACEEPANPIHKVVSTSLRDLGERPDLDSSLWSPAHLLAERFEITDLQYSEIFDRWLARDNTDKWNYDLRDAACGWVVDNFDLMQSFLPKTFPRVIEEESVEGSGAQGAAIVISVLAMLLLIFVGFAIYRRRNTKVMYHTQLELIYSVVGGLFLVCIGAFILTFPPTDALCITPLWFINLGYVIELLPVVVKVDAINKGREMQRIRVSPKTIWHSILGGCAVIIAFLTAWTILDRPRETTSYILSDQVTGFGETVVSACQHCHSDANLWAIIMVTWQAGILLYGLVLAFMASGAQDINGAKSIAMFFAAHVVLLAFRVAFLIVQDSFHQAYLREYQSMLLSLDCIVGVLVFAGPKLLEQSEEKDSDEQMPDLFLETTIVMADIVGFTKWASMREPADVFKLLEQLFSEFDKIAENRRILKVETVGDCYVAASGIPDPFRDHAVIAAKFALDCMNRMHRLIGEMEVRFGPDTSELSLRIGMHSGAVTGGFLRGKGARFQLFGSTMNVCGFMESSGVPGKIHISEACAEKLKKAGREQWIQKRDDQAYTKGKGARPINTFWLSGGHECLSERQVLTDEDHSDVRGNDSPDKQKQRLVKWNTEILLEALKEIVAGGSIAPAFRRSKTNEGVQSQEKQTPTMPLDEVKEIIYLPPFNRRAANRRADVDAIEIPEAIVEQLTTLVDEIASGYNANPFHNFQHASHVVMAVTKYLNRINAPVDLQIGKKVETVPSRSSTKNAAKLHDHTYGITSDPLSQFSIIFAALIHDLDHPGVPNTQLSIENEALRDKYQDRSIAEQNSFDIAWNLFQEDRFNDLRRTICPNESELERFRQLLINAVMATDLGDKELKALRNNRWEKAFAAKDDSEFSGFLTEIAAVSETRHAVVSRKATIVIEHLIQAADISHTCQHWHVYRQWNYNLFREMYLAYKTGRSDKNPADFWYQGEIGFFDFYIIPLSEKLRDCGVFGVSSDENLSYATANKAEWVARGQEVVKEYLELIEREEGFSNTVPEQSAGQHCYEAVEEA